jgi:hypothetical protein
MKLTWENYEQIYIQCLQSHYDRIALNEIICHIQYHVHK